MKTFLLLTILLVSAIAGNAYSIVRVHNGTTNTVFPHPDIFVRGSGVPAGAVMDIYVPAFMLPWLTGEGNDFLLVRHGPEVEGFPSYEDVPLSFDIEDGYRYDVWISYDFWSSYLNPEDVVVTALPWTSFRRGFSLGCLWFLAGVVIRLVGNIGKASPDI